MPKKPATENTKKAAGNARKAASAAAKKEAEDAKRRAAEDAEWAKGAKSNAKKEAEAEKKAEAAKKKAEKEALLKAEMESLKSAKPSASKDKPVKKSAPAPLLRPGIDTALEAAKGEDSKVLPALVASGIDDALDALSLTTGVETVQIDRHPERRVKAAYMAYEERRLPQLKEEIPGLRMKQRKEILRKEFDKSEENPMNQHNRIVRYDATKEEIAAKREADRTILENRLAAEK
ncbi:hypothetical protein BDZ91DRAFT_747605 [Kalaharituber pfeilii]|nr:hypothetical protein BDZ91DRAFT_747605 [Kalaharituber pfeilii]